MDEKNFVKKDRTKILSEMGFNEPTFGYFDFDGLKIEKYFRNPDNLNSKFERFNKLEERKYSAPTVNQALDWIFDNFNYSVECIKSKVFFDEDKNEYVYGKNIIFIIKDNNLNTMIFISKKYYKNISDAKLDALEYIIDHINKNEIKEFLIENELVNFFENDKLIEEFLKLVN